MAMENMAIQNSLWTFRRQRGLSQKRVAYLVGHKTSSQLSHYERGAKHPSLINALKLEIVYHVPVASLYGDLHRELKEEIEAREVTLRRPLECP